MSNAQQRTIPITENGRLNIPADMRRALGLEGAGRVILRMDENGIHIMTREHALQRVRELMAPYVTDGVSRVDELIAERRAEAAKDEAEAQAWNASRNKAKTADDV
ncbi:MAG: AbrB/MazE/SpoVT family DNA-binding domain-containing protein [Fulvimarina manganoxydans]|uniref:AbrB/MazE/SpoVT family DNA-binding domain-containing protein n=1 Tax=Fulvimarina manganoxydans TaxID=937218 RepID=UPI00235356A5|nr:AbrB/MazE/SpoVT family DNA-binding domain-containing protein [Fulvimarina manganoxydans]MCK5930960.1 AbrB/MazE/SpoVT family DNA-binding domain-containing protein [Fulvimarina manganoxydans]